MILHFEPANYLRIEEPRTIDTSAAGASFATSTGDILEVTSHGPGVFRLRLGPNARNDYGIIVGRSKPCTVAQTRTGVTSFTAGDAMLEISGGPLRFRLLWRNRPLFGSITDEHRRGFTRLPAFGRIRQGGEWTASFALVSGESVYGLGEKTGPLDKRGQIVHSQVEPRMSPHAIAGAGNTPFAWSAGQTHGAWGVFVHTPGRVAHGVGFPDWSQRSYAVVVDDEALDVFLFAADAPAALLDHYAHLTGRVPDVPRWSLGLWVSRVHDANADATLAATAKLRERHIPADVVTIDGHAADAAGFNFRLDPARLPDAPAAFAALHAQHFRVCVRESPCVPVHDPLAGELFARHFLLKNSFGEACLVRRSGESVAAHAREAAGAHGREPDNAIVDFTHPGAYGWWQDAHRELFESGVDAIETDAGEIVPEDSFAHNGDRGRRLHNVYPLLYNRCVLDATRKFGSTRNGSPVVSGRAAWSGQQRHPIGWGAEAQGDWEGLAASLRAGLSWGMSGHPLHGADIGGSYGAAPLTAELFVRWLQAAVFGSHMRLGAGNAREPWSFGPQAEAVARKWLAFRYRLIPYLEQTIRSAGETGLPVMRAMPLAFPGNALTRRYDTQFMCGETLLVAPIVHPEGEVEVALPPGAWFDLNSRTRYAGRQVLRYRAALDQFPVFGREGHVLALGPAVQHTQAMDAEQPIEQLWVFGTPTGPVRSTQVAIDVRGGQPPVLRVASGVQVQFFGEALPVGAL